MTLDPATETLTQPRELLTRKEASAVLPGFGIRMRPATLARAFSSGTGGPPCQRIRNRPF